MHIAGDGAAGARAVTGALGAVPVVPCN